MIADLLDTKGSTVVIHIEADRYPCPCRTPEGYRDPVWHKENPTYPECNAAGYVVGFTDIVTKAFILPVNSATRSGMSNITELFGEIQTDDHIGVFKTNLGVDFSNWSPAGENYILHMGHRYIVVSYALIPDPSNTSNMHHYECGLRRIDDVDPDAVEVF